jgi:signal transduction histidine kinase
MTGDLGVDTVDGDIDADTSTAHTVDQTLTALTRLATRLCGVPNAIVTLLDDQDLYQVAATGGGAGTCSAEDPLCGRALADRRLLVVEDTRLDRRFHDSPFVDGRRGSIRFYASAPLLTPTGHALGTLSVHDTAPGGLSDEQQDSLRVLADGVVEVIEQRRQTRWLDLVLSELTRSNAVLTDFAGRLSHDLKTPLTAMLGFAEVLETLPAVEEDARAVRYVGRIVGSGNRMRVLIDDLLSFAAVGGSTTVTPVDLEPLVAAVADDLAPLVLRRGATVTATDTTVLADPVQLRVLVQNLVANALAYGVGGDDVTDRTVEVSSDAWGTGWVLHVVDHGPGIPEEQREHLLEPLTRLERDSAWQGSGIGLATCRRVAQAHGGSVELGDTPGGGTTVTVSVPG